MLAQESSRGIFESSFRIICKQFLSRDRNCCHVLVMCEYAENDNVEWPSLQHLFLN